MAKKTTSPVRHDGETETRILNAAKAVFIRHGTSGARMQDIAEEAGVNQALLHYYFRSKEKLSEAVFRDTGGRMFPLLLGIVGSDKSLDEKIDLIVDTYLTQMTRTPFLPGYILSELHHHPERMQQLLGQIADGDITTITHPAFEKLEKQLKAEARAGRMRKMNVAQFFVNLVSLCIFPFAARPMLHAAFGFDDEQFAKFIEQRRVDLPIYIRKAIQP